MYFLKHIAVTLLFILPGVLTEAQTTPPKREPPNTRILFIFDASQSMMAMWESDRKIHIARQTLITIIDSLEHLDNVQMALRIV